MSIDKIAEFFPKIELKTAGFEKTGYEKEYIWSSFEKGIFNGFPRYFQYLLEILERVRDDKNCFNALEKMNEIGNFRNVDSFLSECKFAIEYLNVGYKVDFVLDNDKRFKGESPDLIIKNNDNEVWIEVRSFMEIYDVREIVLQHLRNLCKKIKEKNIGIWYGVDYSHEDFWKNYLNGNLDKLILPIKKSIEKFQKMLEDNSYHLKLGEYDFGIIKYKVDELPTEKPLVIGGLPNFQKIELDFLVEFIDKITNEKAKKAIKWDEKIKYYIGLDFQHWAYDEDDLAHVLYGNKFLFSKNPNSKEISGILAFFRFGKRKVHVFHNPYAKKTRKNLDYEWLGLLPEYPVNKQNKK